MLSRRLDIMGKPKNLLENINQITIHAGTLLPHINYLRKIPRSLWLYAGMLQKEGKQQEALKIIAPWKTYIEQITKNSNFYIDMLIDMAIAEAGEQTIPEIYRKAGKFNLAKTAKNDLAKITAINKQWKADVKKYRMKYQSLKKAGILAVMLLPALGKVDFTEEDFAISNKIEHTAVEKAGVIFLNLFFLIGMIGGLLTALYWRIRTKQKALLLAPSAQLLGKVFLLGIIIPLTAYILISISGIVGGHEYSLMYNGISMGAQFTILLTVIPAIIFILIRKHIHQCCLEIGISYPEIKKCKVWRIILLIIFSIFVLIALLPIHIMPRLTLIMPTIIIGLSSALCILISYIIILMAEYFTTIFSDKQYALYYGALAKTLTLVLALAMIFMTLIIIPYLEWREANLISKDKIMYGQSKSVTHVEYRVVQRLKAAMLKALE